MSFLNLTFLDSNKIKKYKNSCYEQQYVNFKIPFFLNKYF